MCAFSLFGSWLHEHYRWFVPLVFGSLLALTGVRYVLAMRAHDRDEKEIIDLIRRGRLPPRGAREAHAAQAEDRPQAHQLERA